MATEAMESGNSAVEEQPTLNPEGTSTTETNPAEGVQPSTQTGASGNMEAKAETDNEKAAEAKAETDNEKAAEGNTEDDKKEEIPDGNKDEVKHDEGNPEGDKEKENKDGNEGEASEVKTTPTEGNADGDDWKEKEWKTTHDEGNADGNEWKEKEWKTTHDEGNADGNEWKEKEWKTTQDEGNSYGDDWKNEWKGNEWKGDEWKTNGNEETTEAEGSGSASIPGAEGLGAPPGLSLEPADNETNEYGWQNWDAQNTASDTSVPKPKAVEDETEQMDWSTFRGTAEAKDDSETHWLEADQAKGLLNGPMSQGKPVAASARDRICALTGVEIEMEEPWSGIPVTLTIKSNDAEKRRLAYKYARIAGKAHAQQMWTDVHETDDDDGDLSTVEFPQSMQFVFGRQGAKLAQVGEGSNTLLFFMNDENAAKKPAAPWLGVGKRVEVKQGGDVRTDNWHTGTVAEVQRSGSARVKLDSGADCIADIKNARPRFELQDEVEVHQEGDTWQQAVVEERKDSGTLVVRLPASTEEGESTTQEVDPTAARPRTPAKDGEEETAENVPEPTSRIAIFGALQDRTIAQLRLMAAVGRDWPDYYKDYRPEWGAPADSDWGAEVLEIEQHFLPQCIGKQGQMRCKLSKAAECLIEYVGNTAYVCGAKEQRSFGAALIKVLCSSDRGNVGDVPEEALPHASTVLIPEDSVSFVMGSKRSFMSRIEEEEGVIVFLGAPAEKKEDQSWGGNAGWGEGGWNESSWKEEGDSKWNESQEQGDSKWNESAWQQGSGGTEEGEQATEKAAEEAQEEKKEEEKQEEEKKEEEKDEKEEKKEEDKDEEKKEENKNEEKKEEDKDEEKKEEDTKEKEEEKEAEEEQADVRKVYIFAYTTRSRTMATLRVQSAVESKNPGYCTEGVVACTSNEDGFGTDICEVPADAISFVMGKQGTTKKKLQAAAGCGLEYVGSFAYILGTREERERGRQYLEWLQLQRGGSDHTIELSKSTFSERKDVTMITLSTAERQLLDTQTLTTIEQNTSTFMQFRVPTSEEIFIPGAIVELSRQGRTVTAELLSVADKEDGGFQLRFCKDANQYADSEEANAELLIFGHDAGENGQSGRGLAEKQVWEAVAQAQGGAGGGDDNGWDSWGGDHEKEDQSKAWGQDKGQEEWSWGGGKDGGKDGATWEDSKDKWEEEHNDEYNANNNSAHGRNKNQNYNQHNTSSDHDYKNSHDDNSKQYSKGSNHYQNNNSYNNDDKYHNNSNTNNTNGYNKSGQNKTSGASEEQGWAGNWGEADEWHANGAGKSNDRSRGGDRSGAGHRNQEKAKWPSDDAAEGHGHWSSGGNRQDKQGGHTNEESGDGNSAWANWKGCAASLSEWGDGGAEKTHNENPWDNWGGGAGADKSKNDDAWEGWGGGGWNKRQGRR